MAFQVPETPQTKIEDLLQSQMKQRRTEQSVAPVLVELTRHSLAQTQQSNTTANHVAQAKHSKPAIEEA